jgi:hypothetical protein
MAPLDPPPEAIYDSPEVAEAHIQEAHGGRVQLVTERVQIDIWARTNSVGLI